MDGRILQRVPTNRFGVVSMSRAFRADKEQQVYMGEATHRKTTANKPKQGDMKMKIEHTNYEDMTKKELKYLCAMAGHKRSGTKAQLLHRLEYHSGVVE